jgi:hypothetical protein
MENLIFTLTKENLDHIIFNSEIEFKLEKDAFIINANKDGLIYLANALVELAKEKAPTHRHFDRSGVVDRCDKELIVVLKQKNFL